MTRHPAQVHPVFAATFADWAIQQLVARYSFAEAQPVIPLVPARNGDVRTAFGRFTAVQPSPYGLFDPLYTDFLMPAAAAVPWLPSPRQAVRTLPSRLDVVTDAFGYDHTGRPAALPPRRPLVRITPADKAHWRAFVRFFGPRCEFALHTAAAGARRTPARCR
jgi:hypothetical protein